MTFHVTFSFSTGRSAVHAPTCRQAEIPRTALARVANRGHIVVALQAATPQEAAQAWTESEELVFRGFPLPVICHCALSLSPSEV
jgi:hypothetical protein